MVKRSALAEPVSRHDAAYRDLVSKIRGGQLIPGARLPAETELAEKYGISRTSIRKGLERMHRQGLLVKRRGSGTYVSSTVEPRATEKSVLLARLSYDIFNDSDAWSRPLKKALYQAAMAHRLSLLADVSWPASAETAMPIQAEMLAGVIAIPIGSIKPSEVLEGISNDVPRVVINRPSDLPDVPGIDVDLGTGTFDAVSHLLRLGHRRIAIAVRQGPPDVQSVDAYRRAYQAAGLPVDERLIAPLPSQVNVTRWPEAIAGVLTSTPRPTALLMNFTDHPMRMLSVIRSTGLRIPEDLSLVVFDDDASLIESDPSISTIVQPVDRMAQLAVQALSDMVRGAAGIPHLQRLPSYFVVRNSVSLPPA